MKRLNGLIATLEAQVEILDGLADDMQQEYLAAYEVWMDSSAREALADLEGDQLPQPDTLDAMEALAENLRSYEIDLSHCLLALGTLK